MRRPVFWNLLIVSVLAFGTSLYGCGSSDNSTPADGDPDTEAETQTDGDAAETEAEESEATEEEADGADRPDPSFIYERREAPQKAADESYVEEKMDYVFANTNGSPIATDIRVLKLIDGTLYIGTSAGLYKKAAGDTAPVLVSLLPALSGETTEPAIVGIGQTIEDGKLMIALEKRVLRFNLGTPATSMMFSVPEDTETLLGLHAISPTLAIAHSAHYVYFIYSATIGKAFTADFETETPELIGAAFYDFANSQIFVGTNRGVYIVPLQLPQKAALKGRKEYQRYDVAGGKLLDDKVQSLALCGDTLLVGSGLGLSLIKGDTATFKKAEPDHLAYGDITSISCLDNTAALLGHKIGATYLKLDDSHMDFYQSQRWLADNTVQAVALAADGTRYVGTKAGLSRIYLVTRTLADKEKVFESYVPSFWRMDGFFSSDSSLPDPYSSYADHYGLSDMDNDGLWTQMMIGGWCQAYAQTKNEIYYQHARKAMDNMFLLVDIPAISFKAKGMDPGFVARSVVRDDEGEVFNSKKTQSNWHLVNTNGHDYYWKDDTSSDELTGHWYGYALFYDLCAKDDAERQAIVDHLNLITGYIVKNGLKLIDLDGARTTWGKWDPDTIAIALDGMGKCYTKVQDLDLCASAFGGGGWLNSIQILGGLLATYHLTKNPLYYDTYNELITKYRYDELAMTNDNTKTVVMNGTKNHSDHELAILAYNTLFRYESDPARRAKWQDSIKFFYKYERPERNPLWAAIYSLAGVDDAAAEDARRTLREMPDDLRNWGIDNSIRKDASYVGLDRHKNPEIDRVFPYDEIRTMWWNGNPYASTEGGDGRSVNAPTAWLLAYYSARYSGILY